MFIDLLNDAQFNQYGLTSLYTGIMAGSPCPLPTMHDVIAKMHMQKIVVSIISLLIIEPCKRLDHVGPVYFYSLVHLQKTSLTALG